MRWRRSGLAVLVIDCHDPALLALYSALVGGRVIDRGPDWSVIEPDDGNSLRIGFQRVPERKQVKNRVHLDVLAPDLEAAARGDGRARSGEAW